jgi:hypothetical protein
MAARCATAMIAFSTVTLVLLRQLPLIIHSSKQCWGSGSGSAGSACFWTSQIRIIDPLVKGTDPAPDPAPDPSLFLIYVLSGLK